MPPQHSAIDQCRYGNSALGSESADDIQIKALEIGVARWSVYARRTAMDEDRHIKLTGLSVQRVELGAIE